MELFESAAVSFFDLLVTHEATKTVAITNILFIDDFIYSVLPFSPTNQCSLFLKSTLKVVSVP